MYFCTPKALYNHVGGAHLNLHQLVEDEEAAAHPWIPWLVRKLKDPPMRSVRAAGIPRLALPRRWCPFQSPLRSVSPQSPLQSPLRSVSPQGPLQSPLRSGSPQSPEPAPFQEPTESAPEPAPFREPTEPAPFQEPTEPAPEPAPFREPTESTQETASLKWWLSAPPWWHPALPAPPWPPALPAPPWHHCLPIPPGPLPLHGPGPPSLTQIRLRPTPPSRYIYVFVCGASGIHSLKGGGGGLCMFSTWLVVCCWCHVLSCVLSVPSHLVTQSLFQLFHLCLCRYPRLSPYLSSWCL